MNKYVASGNLIKDPELKSTEKGTEVAKFCVATKKKFKNADGKYDNSLLNCKVYGKGAEIISKYFKKGSAIEICGWINTFTYQEKGYTEIIVEDFAFCSKEWGNKEDKKEEPKKAEAKRGSLFDEEISEADLISDEDLPF